MRGLPEMRPDGLERLHQEHKRFLQRQQHGGRGGHRDTFAWRKEAELGRKLAGLGYRCHATVYRAPFDFWVEGVRIEFKASRCYHDPNTRRYRYQANIRHHEADFLIFNCVNGTDHYYVIPMAAVAPRHNIAITSYDPGEYIGQWAEYLDRWDLLAAAVEAAVPVSFAWQPKLFEEVES